MQPANCLLYLRERKIKQGLNDGTQTDAVTKPPRVVLIEHIVLNAYNQIEIDLNDLIVNKLFLDLFMRVRSTDNDDLACSARLGLFSFPR